MRTNPNCVMLIDDDDDDNFFHSIVLNEMHATEHIEVVDTALKALEYLRENTPPPDLIFLDINMPKMNGWEFLEQYQQLSLDHKAKVVIIMLTTSLNPSDLERSKKIKEINGFETKPLTEEKLEKILATYFEV